MKFMSFIDRKKFISNNRILNYISLDNNKNLVFNNSNYEILKRYVKKIRSLS
jgi:hypothetical protein